MDKAKLLKDLEEHIEKHKSIDSVLYDMLQNYELHRIADALEELVKLGERSQGIEK